MPNEDTYTKEFYKKISEPHRRVDPCFMTGKGCVYTEIIDKELERHKDENSYEGFMIIPFRPNMETFFDLCLKRFVSVHYSEKAEESTEVKSASVCLVRADHVTRTGYVICKKICRKIQESDFVLADVSVPNPNVFYELGLAYGIEHKIVLINHSGSTFGKNVVNYLRQSADHAHRSYEYRDLGKIKPSSFKMSDYMWKRDGATNVGSSSEIQITLIEGNCGKSLQELRGIPIDSAQTRAVSSLDDDISLDFKTHVLSAIGVAIADIIKDLKSENNKLIEVYKNEISGLEAGKRIEDNVNFDDICQEIQKSFCTVIRTGAPDYHPMAYFWLGYCHALGKNVIPISAVDKPGEDIKDLAFDIRALWHMTFARKNPTRHARELKDTLYQMIKADFEEWSRKRFWDEILGKRGEVSIFTGALHNPYYVREMIGDWDLRTVSELTSYFASHDYRATIESPVNQYETVVHDDDDRSRAQYIEVLENMLENKNCIIIASSDVNPFTEVVLGKIYGIPQNKWFKEFGSRQIKNYNAAAVVAIKQKIDSRESKKDKKPDKPPKRVFYREELISKGRTQRGFESSAMAPTRIMEKFISQTEAGDDFNVPAHLLIVQNPFGGKGKYIIVLNGISGPATFALTHVLTGGKSEEFVDYGGNFDPYSKSEKMLQEITGDLLISKRIRSFKGLQYIIKVSVCLSRITEAKAKGIKAGEIEGIQDWRRIKEWGKAEVMLAPQI